MKSTNQIALPRVIRIEPSASCNLSCIHCPTGLGMGPCGIMSMETFNRALSIIEPIKESVSVVVMYHGGEPLINPNFEQMVLAVKSIGVKYVKTVTNGMLLNKRRAESLMASGIDAIEISLDGVTIEENGRLRRGADFSIISENIEFLCKLKREEMSNLEIIISSVQVPSCSKSCELLGTPGTSKLHF